MNKTLLFIVLALNSFFINAASEFDRVLQRDGIVDSNFRIIEHKKFDELMRTTTNNMASMFPTKVDASSTILSVNVSRFGIYTNYQLEDVETKKEAEYVLFHFGLAQDYKNYLCSSEFANSETFKKLNAKFNINFLNTDSSVIYSLKIPISSC